jgi:hypothetical protein
MHTTRDKREGNFKTNFHLCFEICSYSPPHITDVYLRTWELQCNWEYERLYNVWKVKINGKESNVTCSK